MTIAFYLTRPKAETETSIFARISYSGFKFKYYIPEKINPKFWSSDTQRAKETQRFKEFPEFNARLNNIEMDMRNAIRKYVNDNEGTIPNTATLKILLDKEIKKLEPVREHADTFFVFFEQFIKRSAEGTRINTKSKKGTVYNTNKGYITTLAHLQTFQKQHRRKIDFETVDLEFYNEYVKYLTYTVKLSANTIGDHIKRIKTVMSEATERGVNKNLAFRSRYFTKPYEQTESIYLTDAELKELVVLDLTSNPKLERVRDLFVIGCYTGLRYSDYSIIKPDQISNGFIKATQKKTGQTVVVPIHPTVKTILHKYGGSLPKSISNQKTNDYLKELGNRLECLKKPISLSYTKGGVKVTETCPKSELISTHTARRSFATNEYLAGTPTVTIMAITGHRTEKAFLGYIKLTSDEHAKLLQLHWQKRYGLVAV